MEFGEDNGATLPIKRKKIEYLNGTELWNGTIIKSTGKRRKIYRFEYLRSKQYFPQ